MDIGVPIKAAKRRAGMPPIPQSTTRISPTCPAMAPRTIPKFNPMPARMGMINERTRMESLPRRVIISSIKY